MELEAMIRDQDKFNDVDILLSTAAHLYKEKKLTKCEEILQRVKFPKFDSREWIIENNLLLCKLKDTNTSKQPSEIIKIFYSLTDKITGLPPQASNVNCELIITFNYSYILLTSHVTCGVIDSCHKASTTLTNAILRAAQDTEWPRERLQLVTEKDVFAEKTCRAVQKSIKNVLTVTQSTVPVALACWLLAIVWISQHKVEYATELLQTILRHLQCQTKKLSPSKKGDHSISDVLIVDSSLLDDVFPLSLLPTPAEISQKSVECLVAFLLSLCHFSNNECEKAAQILESVPQTTKAGKLSFYTAYLKGLMLYGQGAVSEAFACFTACESMREEVPDCHKAAASNMIARCLSKKGKHHTAIAKFKESLMYSGSANLDTIYCIAMEFGQVNKKLGEIQLLKTMVKALRLKKANHTVEATHALCCKHFSLFTRSLDDSEVNLHYATFVLAKRCMDDKRYYEAADAFLDLLSELTDGPRVEAEKECYRLPSAPALYRDCALALLSTERYKDCVTVCDHLLSYTDAKIKLREKGTCTAKESDTSLGSNKRPRLASSEETTDMSCASTAGSLISMEMMLYKAKSLSHMEQLLPALESLKRLFDQIDQLKLSPAVLKDNQDPDERQCAKKRKLDSGNPSSYSVKINLEASHPSSSVHSTDQFRKVKAQAHIIRALILQSLHQEKESLEELHESLQWDPGSLVARHHHSSLLFKLHQSGQASLNWATFRGMGPGNKSTVQPPDLYSFTTGIPLSHWITSKQITAMDGLALQHHKTKSY